MYKVTFYDNVKHEGTPLMVKEYYDNKSICESLGIKRNCVWRFCNKPDEVKKTIYTIEKKE